MPGQHTIDHGIWKEIIDSVKDMSYGELIIVVHDSEIVQIEKRVKKRFALKGGRNGMMKK